MELFFEKKYFFSGKSQNPLYSPTWIKKTSQKYIYTQMDEPTQTQDQEGME